MEPTTFEGIRPEFLEAVASARFNLWLAPLFLAAPLLLLVSVLRRWHWAVIGGVTLLAAFATWISYFGYSETIWKTMEAHAETSAEIDEVTSDTDRVFGPFFLGIPIAVVYCTAWWAMAFGIRLVTQKLRARRSASVQLGSEDNGKA